MKNYKKKTIRRLVLLMMLFNFAPFVTATVHAKTDTLTQGTPEMVALEEDTPLTFHDSSDYDIATYYNLGGSYFNYTSEAIPTVSVADGVVGGTKPYTFSKKSGPDWIKVSADGIISGTPTEVADTTTLVVRVTDKEGCYEEITIKVYKVEFNPVDRVDVSTVVATSDIANIIGDGKNTSHATFTITEGTTTRITSYGWQVKSGEVWNAYNDSIFTEGTYRYKIVLNLWSTTHKLAENLSFSVDGVEWQYEKGSIFYQDDASWVYLYSPEFVVLHDWDEGVATTPATCETDGVKTYTCKNDSSHTKTEIIEKLGHTTVIDKAIAPTNTTEGKTEGSHCSVCNKVLVAQETIAKLPLQTKKGDIVKSGKYKYKVTSVEEKTVQFTGATSKNVTKLTIPSSIKVNGISYRVTSIAPNAFKNHKKLTKVIIGSSVTTIGARAFYNCKKLTSVSIGKNVKSIGKQAFYNCKKLKSITIKSKKFSKKSIGKWAFKNISSKATIKVPKTKKKAYKTYLKKAGVSKKAKFK